MRDRKSIARVVAGVLGVTILLADAAGPARGAAQGSNMSVFAAPGPHGMTIRWIPQRDDAALRASVVRISADGSRGAPIEVTRPTDAASLAANGLPNPPPDVANVATFNADIDAKHRGIIAAIGTIELALVRGDAFVDRGVVAGKSYRYEVKLSDGESGTSRQTPPAGSTPPAGRYGLGLVSAKGGDRSAIVSVAAPFRIGFVRIYRDTGAGFTMIATVGCSGKAGPTLYHDRVAAAMALRYRASYVDLLGNEGGQSAVVSARSTDLSPPAAVTGVKAVLMGNAVSLTWSPSKDASLAGYDIFRSADASRSAKIATVPASRSAFADAIRPGVLYTYDVRARSIANVDGYPSVGSAVQSPKTTPPDAPQGLTAKSTAEGIELAWTASNDPTTRRYEIYSRAPKAKPLLLAQRPTRDRTYLVRLPAGEVAASEYGVGAQDRFGNRAAPVRWVAARLTRANFANAAAPVSVRVVKGIVMLTLSPVTDPDVVGEAIYRSVDGRASAKLTRIAPSSRSYADTSAQAGHAYGYALASIASDGREGTRSSIETVTLPLPALTAPKPTLTLLQDGLTVQLRWPATRGLLGYQIVRRNPNGSVATIASMVRAFSYEDVLTPGAHGEYAYALRVITRSGVGSTGASASITIRQ